jgi:LPXTG-motif cell wall-anchored protein
MDNVTMIRVVAGILAVVVLAILIQRRRKRIE